MTKRIFDSILSLIGLLLVGGFLLLFWIMASIDTPMSLSSGKTNKFDCRFLINDF
jgi:lipopolysaccharide/colanic/teichoic acid biosynthesis glycosyltransferase